MQSKTVLSYAVFIDLHFCTAHSLEVLVKMCENSLIHLLWQQYENISQFMDWVKLSQNAQAISLCTISLDHKTQVPNSARHSLFCGPLNPTGTDRTFKFDLCARKSNL